MTKNPNPCCVPECGNKNRAHNLCDTHLYRWQTGKIPVHPEKQITWQEHKQTPEFKSKSRGHKNRKEPIKPDKPTKAESDELKWETLTKMDLMILLRTRLEECQHLAAVLGMLGMGDKVKAEIHKYLTD